MEADGDNQPVPPIVLSTRERVKADDLVQKLLDHNNTGAAPSPARIVKPFSKLSSDTVHPFKASGESNLVVLRTQQDEEQKKI